MSRFASHFQNHSWFYFSSEFIPPKRSFKREKQRLESFKKVEFHSYCPNTQRLIFPVRDIIFSDHSRTQDVVKIFLTKSDVVPLSFFLSLSLSVPVPLSPSLSFFLLCNGPGSADAAFCSSSRRTRRSCLASCSISSVMFCIWQMSRFTTTTPGHFCHCLPVTKEKDADSQVSQQEGLSASRLGCHAQKWVWGRPLQIGQQQ